MGKFSIQESAIDLTALRKEMEDPTCGAIVSFEGLVRNHHEGRNVTALKYTHHPLMAEKEGQRILEKTLEKTRINARDAGQCERSPETARTAR